MASVTEKVPLLTSEIPDNAAQTTVTVQGLHYEHKMDGIFLLNYYILKQ